MACAIEDAGFEIRDCIGWIYGCLSEDTEILTINGWEHYHKALDKNPVLCYNVESGRYEFQKPTRSFCYENEYTAYRIQSDKTDQIVSRNHRVVIERGGKLIFQRAEELQSEESIPFLESLPDLSETLSSCNQRTGSEKQGLQGLYKEEKGKMEYRQETKENNMSNLQERILSYRSSKKKPRIYCSRSCAGKAKDWLKQYSANGKGIKNPKKSHWGKSNPAWKGGVTYFNKHGNYLPIKYIRCPKEYLSMARKDGYVMEHRLIMAQELRRPLLRTEVIHHINHNPQDNRLKNLQLFQTNKAHKLFEAQEQQ